MHEITFYAINSTESIIINRIFELDYLRFYYNLLSIFAVSSLHPREIAIPLSRYAKQEVCTTNLSFRECVRFHAVYHLRALCTLVLCVYAHMGNSLVCRTYVSESASVAELDCLFIDRLIRTSGNSRFY